MSADGRRSRTAIGVRPRCSNSTAVCRQYASQRTSAQAGNNRAEAAAAGVGVGAAAGALIGAASAHAGSGAAIGAEAGLLTDGLAVAPSRPRAQAAAQKRYDAAYMQWMVGNGERIAASVGTAPG
jgi:hypothetical protein